MRRGKGWGNVGAAIAGAAAAYWLVRRYRALRAHCPPFDRQTYARSQDLARAFRELWRQPEALRSLLSNPAIETPLADKILLAVSGHYSGERATRALARLAERLGLSPAEGDALRRGELGPATAEEAPALFFAAQYAREGGAPDADLVQSLTAAYGARTARDLITYIRLAAFANLAGNTFDALVSRALGQPSPGTSLGEELLASLILVFGVAPLLPVLILRAVLPRRE